MIEQGAPLLKLENLTEYNEQILIRAAKHSEENDRVPEAIKLYNLAGDYTTVIACLAHALGNTIAQPGVDEKARAIERTAADILRHYERTNRAVGKDRDAVIRLLRVREAMDAKEAGRVELALEASPPCSIGMAATTAVAEGADAGARDDDCELERDRACQGAERGGWTGVGGGGYPRPWACT